MLFRNSVKLSTTVLFTIFFFPFNAICQPVIEVEPDEIDFGEVEQNETGTESITISNNGDEALIVSEFETDNEIFSAGWREFTRLELVHFEHWEAFEPGLNAHIFLIQSIRWDNELPAVGVDVGVFMSGDDLCVGVTVVEEVGRQLGFAAWPETDDAIGFIVDEEFEFRLWDRLTECEVLAEYELIHGNEVFRENGFTVVNLTAEGGVHRIGGGGIVVGQELSSRVPVRFKPEEVGDYEGTLTIHSNDEDNEEVTVDLLGSCSDGESVSDDDLSGIPGEFLLLPAFPNPFNSRITVNFGIPVAGEVDISLFDLNGKRISGFSGNSWYPEGYHMYILNFEGIPAGIYLLNLGYNSRILTQRVTLVK